MSENFKKEEGLYISQICDISLEQFIFCRNRLCCNRHHAGCKECPLLVNVARSIIDYGVFELSKLYRKHFATTYRSSNAIRRLMQLPVVVFRLDEKRGIQKLFVIEKQCGIDYRKLVNLVHKFTLETKLEKEGIAKETLHDLCNLASTEGDRKLLKFAVCQAGNYSNKNARQKLGIHSISKLKVEIESAVKQAEEIRKEVSELAAVREKSALRCLGLYFLDECDSNESEREDETDESDNDIEWHSEIESDADNECVSEIENTAPSLPESQLNFENSATGNELDTAPLENRSTLNELPTQSTLLLLLRESNFNWFCFVEEVKLLMRDCNNEVVDKVLVDFNRDFQFMELNNNEKERTEISKQAYLNSEKVGTINNTGLTDSESDDPEDWLNLNVKSEKGKEVLLKQRGIIKRLAKRQQAKLIAERCLLKRKMPKRVSLILKRFPNIGKDIEEFVVKKLELIRGEELEWRLLMGIENEVRRHPFVRLKTICKVNTIPK